MAARAPHGNNQPPKIIVKKIYIEGHGGHHGGAWKVAYADFVTAMMAFFLLMWLLGATTEKQRKGIADYFAPTIINTKSLGMGGTGLLGGQSVSSQQKTGSFDGNSRLPTIVSKAEGSGGPEMGTGKKGSLRSPQSIAACVRPRGAFPPTASSDRWNRAPARWSCARCRPFRWTRYPSATAKRRPAARCCPRCFRASAQA